MTKLTKLTKLASIGRTGQLKDRFWSIWSIDRLIIDYCKLLKNKASGQLGQFGQRAQPYTGTFDKKACFCGQLTIPKMGQVDQLDQNPARAKSMPENSNNQKLECHKHGASPYLIVDVPGDSPRYWCLTCLEDVFVRLGVHAMFPARSLGQTDSSQVEEWPDELEEVK